MHTLKQKGRWIHIEPKPPQRVLNLLNAELSYKKTGAEFMGNPEWAWVKLYQPGRQRFPIGLLNRVIRLFKNNNVQYAYNQPPALMDSIKLEGKGLRYYQQRAIAKLVLHRGGILQLPTGAGKTRTCLELLKQLDLKTLIIVPSLYLRKQWEDQIDNPMFVVRTYQGLKSRNYIQQFDVVTFDECHITAAATLQKIGMNLKEDAITIGLSATAKRRENDNLKVEGVLGEIVHSITLRELIEDGYLSDATVVFHKMSHHVDKYADYQTMYSDYIINNHERNKKIYEIATEAKKNVLILVDRIEHGEVLLEEFKYYGKDAVFLHGTSKNIFDIKHDIIIATSIFDQGVDVPSWRHLILASGGKSAIKVIQRMGRVLRVCDGKDGAMIHDFVDQAKWLFAHSTQRMEIMKESFEVMIDGTK